MDSNDCNIYRESSGVNVNTYCAPDYLWSSTRKNADWSVDSGMSYDANVEYITHIIINRTAMSNSGSALHMASARCFTSPWFVRTVSGGGGGAGATFKNYNIIERGFPPPVGSLFTVVAGAGGKGGSGCSKVYKSTDSNSGTCSQGGAGGNSKVTYRSGPSGSTTEWYARGGGPGGAASNTSGGFAGSGMGACSQSSYCYGGGSGTSGKTNYTMWRQSSYQGMFTYGGDGGGAYNRSNTGGGHGYGGAPNAANDSNHWGAGGGGGGASYEHDSGTTNIDVDYQYGGNGANGYAEVTYKEVVRRPSGGGGGGGAFAVLQDIPVQPGYIVEVYVGAGGGTLSYAYEGGMSGVKVMNSSRSTVMEYKLSGGAGGEYGYVARSNGRSSALGGSGGTQLPCTNCSTYRKIYKAGKRGENSSNSEFIGSSGYLSMGVFMGGNGGASGMGTLGGYGGFYTQLVNGVWNNLNSTNPNGLEVDFKAPSMIFGAMDYGAAGAGGGGGGWSWGLSSDYYVFNGGKGAVGDGAKGQDGYVFIMWDKPPES